MENKRIYTIDLLKLIAMLGIVMVHLLNQGGIINNIELNDTKYYIINILLTLSYFSVNIFAIITGFLYSNKNNIKIFNILKLIIEVLFYSICITCIFYGFNLFNVRECENVYFSIFPFLKGRYWYIISYCFLFFLIPFLNIFVKNVSIKELRKLLIGIFILICIIPQILEITNLIFDAKIKTDIFKINDGYSPFWLIYCYLVGAYLLKFYKINRDVNRKRFKKKILILIILTSTLNYFSKVISVNFYGIIKFYDLFISYTSPLNILIATLCVYYFITNNNVRVSKIFLVLSQSSFAVYIIHSHILIYDNIIKDCFVRFCDKSILTLITYIILATIMIYVLSFMIDKIREKLFEILKMDKFIKRVSK